MARWSKTERHGDWGKAESIACQSGTVEGMRTNREGTRSFRAGLVWNPVSAGWGCASRTWGRRPRKPMGNVTVLWPRLPSGPRKTSRGLTMQDWNTNVIHAFRWLGKKNKKATGITKKRKRKKRKAILALFPTSTSPHFAKHQCERILGRVYNYSYSRSISSERSDR